MVSIVILSYNTKQLLEACLTSIYTQIKQTPFEVIVVDNASTDASCEMVKKKFKKARLIQNSENVGFAKGNNIAAEHAKGEFLLFLNSDTEVVDDTLKEMIGYLQNNKQVGITGGKLVEASKKPQQSYGRFLTFTSVFLLLFFPSLVHKKEYLTSKEVDWVSGAFMLIRRSLFTSVGSFDPHFFMYVEDMELCLRIKKAGYTTVYFPHASVKHVGQGSSNRAFAVLHIYTGILYYFKKHKSTVEYTLVKILLRIKTYSALLLGILTGNKYLLLTYKQVLRF